MKKFVCSLLVLMLLAALIFGCAGMSDIKERLEQHLKVPVIAGVISALKIAEQFSGVPHP